MVAKKSGRTREEHLLDLIQRISTEAANHMVAVTAAIGELRSYIDSKMLDILSTCNEGKERAQIAIERQNLTFEKIDNVASEVTAAKNAIEQLTTEIIELEKCAAGNKAAATNGFNWKQKWWQSKEFFLIIIILLLVLLIGALMKVDLVGMFSKLIGAFHH